VDDEKCYEGRKGFFEKMKDFFTDKDKS